jgi:hypothetical protein
VTRSSRSFSVRTANTPAVVGRLANAGCAARGPGAFRWASDRDHAATALQVGPPAPPPLRPVPDEEPPIGVVEPERLASSTPGGPPTPLDGRRQASLGLARRPPLGEGNQPPTDPVALGPTPDQLSGGHFAEVNATIDGNTVNLLLAEQGNGVMGSVDSKVWPDGILCDPGTAIVTNVDAAIATGAALANVVYDLVV